MFCNTKAMGKHESKKSIKGATKAFCESATTHGLSHIFGDKTREMRLLWLILVFTSLGIFLYQIETVFRSFMANRTLTSYEKRQVKSMKFPAVTICPGTVFVRSALSEEKIAYFKPVWRKRFLTKGDIVTQRAYRATEFAMEFDNLDAIRRATMNPDRMFLSKFKSACTFGTLYSCNYTDDLNEIITSSYGGICFQMNKKGKFKQLASGSFYGLSLTIFLNQSEYAPFVSFDVGSGVRLKIHEQDEFPHPEMDGILISAGQLTRISLNKIQYSRLGAPFQSNCTDGQAFNLFYPGKYSVSNCELSCIIRDSLEMCGTTDPLTLMLLNQTGKQEFYKLNKTQLDCVHYAAGVSTSMYRQPCTCPLPCMEVVYKPTVTQTKWPSKADMPFYKEVFSYALGLNMSVLTDEFVYDNFLQVNIFFEEMAYQEVRETREWSTEKLISDIGGQMGVWLGASILSLCELIIFLAKVLKKVLFKYNNAGNVNVFEVQMKNDLAGAK